MNDHNDITVTGVVHGINIAATFSDKIERCLIIDL
jgi:ABC-type hemin transport system ATPase subunit